MDLPGKGGHGPSAGGILLAPVNPDLRPCVAFNVRNAHPNGRHPCCRIPLLNLIVKRVEAGEIGKLTFDIHTGLHIAGGQS